MRRAEPDQLRSPPLPAGAPRPAPWPARLELGFERRGGKTVLAHRAHEGPLAFQKPLYPEGEAICHGILLHPPAGIAGGDELRIAVAVGAQAHALLTTPGAGKWYRSAGAGARLEQRITVADGGCCEWLPQESMVFDGALGELHTEVDLAGSACFIGTEVLVFGRTGSGERFDRGRLSLATRIRRDGRSLWLERGRVDGGGALLDSPVGLDGAPVCGTVLAASPRIDEAAGEPLLSACRALVPGEGRAAVTRLPGLLVARYLGPGAEPARAWVSALWRCLRPALADVPMRAPRIWNT